MDSSNRFQFKLPVIFWVTTLAAASAAIFGNAGLILAGVIAGAWGYVYSGSARWTRFVELILVAGILLMLVTLLLPAIRSAGPAARRTQCINNVKNVMLALLNYEAANGHFPPPYIADESGRPMHSWRVLILPYMQEEALFKAYRMDEPWDGPNNIKLLPQMPWAFSCPAHPGTSVGHSHYMAILGEDTGWDPEGGLSLADCSEGTAKTAVVCETLHGIPWTKPQDITADDLEETLNSDALREDIGGHVIETSFTISGRFIVMGFADGHVEYLRIPLQKNALKKLASRRDSIDEKEDVLLILSRVKWGRLVATVVLIVTCILPVIGLRGSRQLTAPQPPMNAA